MCPSQIFLLQKVLFHTDELRLPGKFCERKMTRFALQSTGYTSLVSFYMAQG